MAQIDRRVPNITVQHLRRDLREADEDRFRLSAALRVQASGGATRRDVCLMLLLGTGIGWLSTAASMTGPGFKAVAADTTLEARPIVLPLAHAPSLEDPGLARPVVVAARPMARERRSNRVLTVHRSPADRGERQMPPATVVAEPELAASDAHRSPPSAPHEPRAVHARIAAASR